MDLATGVISSDSWCLRWANAHFHSPLSSAWAGSVWAKLRKLGEWVLWKNILYLFQIFQQDSSDKYKLCLDVLLGHRNCTHSFWTEIKSWSDFITYRMKALLEYARTRAFANRWGRMGWRSHSLCGPRMFLQILYNSQVHHLLKDGEQNSLFQQGWSLLKHPLFFTMWLAINELLLFSDFVLSAV